MPNATDTTQNVAVSTAASGRAPILAKNVIFLLPDGFGPAADTGYSWFKGEGAA